MWKGKIKESVKGLRADAAPSFREGGGRALGKRKKDGKAKSGQVSIPYETASTGPRQPQPT